MEPGAARSASVTEIHECVDATDASVLMEAHWGIGPDRVIDSSSTCTSTYIHIVAQ